MTLRHIRIFIAVFDCESITRAAETLHMTQPAVTRSIHELEEYYGQRLFERINHRLRITEAGRQFYAHAVHIAGTFDELETEMRRWDEAGLFRVGATIGLGSTLLPEAAAEFRRLRPLARLQVRVVNAAALQNALLRNELDFALVEGGMTDESLVQQPFSADRLRLILPPDDPLMALEQLTLADLQGRDFLLREPGSVGRALVDHVFSAHGIPLRVLWESASTQALIRGVEKGLGLSLLPERLVQEAVQAGRVAARNVEDEDFRRENHLVWHRDKFLSPPLRELMELCRRCGETQG